MHILCMAPSSTNSSAMNRSIFSSSSVNTENEEGTLNIVTEVLMEKAESSLVLERVLRKNMERDMIRDEDLGREILDDEGREKGISKTK